MQSPGPFLSASLHRNTSWKCIYGNISTQCNITTNGNEQKKYIYIFINNSTFNLKWHLKTVLNIKF